MTTRLEQKQVRPWPFCVHRPADINFVAVGAGLVNLYDFDRAQTLLREKGEGYVGMFLIAFGTLFTLWALMLPRNEAHLLAVVVASQRRCERSSKATR